MDQHTFTTILTQHETLPFHSIPYSHYMVGRLFQLPRSSHPTIILPSPHIVANVQIVLIFTQMPKSIIYELTLNTPSKIVSWGVKAY
jgi:hypothetical protein